MAQYKAETCTALQTRVEFGEIRYNYEPKFIREAIAISCRHRTVDWWEVLDLKDRRTRNHHFLQSLYGLRTALEDYVSYKRGWCLYRATGDRDYKPWKTKAEHHRAIRCALASYERWA